MVQTLRAPRRTSRAAILDAAAYVFAQNPGAPLSEVAERAGVGRATLHRHFPSRDDLIRVLCLESIEAIDEAVAPIRGKANTASQDLLQRLEVIVPLGDRYHYLHAEAWRAADDPLVSKLYEEELESLGALVDSLKKEGAIASDVPTRWAVAVLDSLIWTTWSQVQAGTVSRQDAARLAHRTLLEGLGS